MIACASIHGNTMIAAKKLAEILKAKGEKNVVLYDLARDDMPSAIADAYRYDRLVVAAASYDGGIFPCMETFLRKLKAKNFQKRTVGYTLAVWNPAEGITVNGTTATIAAATGTRAGTDAFVNNAPRWFFTYTEQVSIEKDKGYSLTAAMKQQVRELTLIIKPTGDAAGRITEIVAHLTGAARTLDFATDTYGAASNVVLPFTKITEGDDAGKWKATVRLLGVTGTEQLLMGEIRYTDGNPSPTTLKSDLTEALKEFNTGKGKSLTLGGTLVETPEGMEVDGAEINGWEEVKGDDVNADL